LEEERASPIIEEESLTHQFVEDMERLCFEIYKDLFAVVAKQLRPRLLNAVLEHSIYKEDKRNQSREQPEPLPPADKFTEPTEIIATFADCLKALQKHFTYDSVTHQLFMQLFAYADAVMFNALMDGTDLCTCGNGFQVKVTISKLEDWATNNSMTQACEKLRHTAQAASVLVMVDKNIFKDAEMVKAVFPALNFGQIKHLSDNFIADQYCPDPVPQAVKQFLSRKAQEDKSSKHLKLDESRFLPLPVGPL